MSFAVKTEKGKRPTNQDNCLALPLNGGVMLVVSDGMGGHAAGERASELAIDTLKDYMLSSIPPYDGQCLGRGFMLANSEVYRHANENPCFMGMGTTLVAAAIVDGWYTAANVGDSRLYHYHSKDNTITPITHDHSYVHELLRCGLITVEQARVHPNRNLITRAIGSFAEVDVDTFENELLSGDMLILCSDGLHGVVTDDELLKCIESEPNLDSLCERLIELALCNDSRDNITVAIYRQEGETKV